MERLGHHFWKRFVLAALLGSLTTCSAPPEQLSTFVVNVQAVPSDATSLKAIVMYQGRAAQSPAEFALALAPGKTTTSFGLETPSVNLGEGQLVVAIGLFRSDNCLIGTGLSTAPANVTQASLDVAVSDLTIAPSPCTDQLPVITKLVSSSDPLPTKTLSGAQITMTGFGFLPGLAIGIRDQKAVNPNFISPLMVSATLPRLPGATGPQPVTVQNVGRPSVNRTDLLSLVISQVDFAQPYLIQPPPSYPPLRIAAVDLNGDLFPELITTGGSGGSGTLAVYLNHGDGSFESQVKEYLAPASVGLVVGNFDQDSFVDVALLSEGSATAAPKVVVLRGKPDGSFKDSPAEEYGLTLGWRSRDIALGQLVGDSRPDLLVGAIDTPNFTGQSRLVAFRNRGSDFVQETTGTIGFEPSSIRVVDINTDGQPEVVCAQYGGGLWIYPNVNLIGPPSFYPSKVSGGYLARTMLAADINNDKRPDLIVPDYSHSSAFVYLSKANLPANLPLLVDPPGQYAAQNGPSGAALADFDQDGAMDLVISNREKTASLTFLYGKGDGTFDELRTQHIQLVAGSDDLPNDVIVSDLNRDGLPDLVVATSGASRVTVLMNRSL